MPGVLIDMFTKNDLATSITLHGTKIWADEKLIPEGGPPGGERRRMDNDNNPEMFR